MNTTARSRTTASRRRRAAIVTVPLVGVLVACGGDDPEVAPGSASDAPDQAAEDTQDFADAMNDATGSSMGGGTLVFDGQEIPIEAATCLLQGDQVDVGTVGGDSGYRVLVSGSGGEYDVTIVTDSGIWTEVDWQTGTAIVDGSTITVPEGEWRDQDGAQEPVIASAVIECP